MSPIFGRPAADEQAPPADEPAGTGAPAEPTAPDAPSASGALAEPAAADTASAAGTPGSSSAAGGSYAYADSGADSAPGVAVQPGAAEAASASADPGDPDAPGTAGASRGPSVSEAPGAPGASGSAAAGTPDAHDATGAPDADADADREAARVSEPRVPAGPLPASALPGESAGGLDGPLLADVAGLRASWQRIQAGFVDDPSEAVSDAADLVEHTAQALVGALRQRRLRAMWDPSGSVNGLWSSAIAAPASAEPAAAGQPPADEVPDTEQLRLMMQRYRAFFNEVCRP